MCSHWPTLRPIKIACMELCGGVHSATETRHQHSFPLGSVPFFSKTPLLHTEFCYFNIFIIKAYGLQECLQVAHGIRNMYNLKN